MFRDEIGMAAEAVASASDLDDDGVVQEPIEERGGDDGTAGYLTPLGEAPVRGQDKAAFRSGH